MPATTITATVRNALGLVSRPFSVLALIAETGMGLGAQGNGTTDDTAVTCPRDFGPGVT